MSSIIEVRPGNAVMWIARDLMEGESFQIMYSPDSPSDKCAKFTPLVLAGVPLVLDPDNPMQITAIPGYYRAVPDVPPLRASVAVTPPFPATLNWSMP